MNQINREQIKNLANLYDIKVMSQAIADKGWACLSHTTRKDIAKADVPTLYNDILAKYDSMPESMPSSPTQGFSIYNATVKYFKGKYWFVSSNHLHYNTVLNDDASLVTISESNFGNGSISWPLIAGNNILLGCFSQNWYKITDVGEYATITAPESLGEYGVTDFFTYIDDGYIYITIPFDNYYYSIWRIADNASATEIELVATFSHKVRSLCKKGDTWYIVCDDGVYTTTNLADTTSWELKKSSSGYNGNWVTILYSEDADKFIIFGWGNDQYIYTSTDDFDNVTEILLNFNQRDSIPVLVGNTIYTQGRGYQVYYLAYQTLDNLSQNWNTVEFSYEFSCLYYGNKTLIITNQNSEMWYYPFGKNMSTDTYVINGTSVAINYYNADGFKICIADGGTNDTNLATVYSYMGYYNYYRLDTGNETLSLPRNSNLWTFMYVGDNYEDSNLPSGNTTRLLPQAEIISDSSASVSLAVKGNKDYQLTNSALSSLTISSCEDSQLGTTIRFNSGATATTITDSASIDWIDGATPIPSASKTCLIFIWNKTGFYKEW